MARQCMRPDCTLPVAAHVTVDPAGCAVWLDRPGAGSGQAQQLCLLHAEALTVPRGWTITDRRQLAEEEQERPEPAPTSHARAAPHPPKPADEVPRGRLLERALAAASGPQRSVLTQPPRTPPTQ